MGLWLFVLCTSESFFNICFGCTSGFAFGFAFAEEDKIFKIVSPEFSGDWYKSSTRASLSPLAILVLRTGFYIDVFRKKLSATLSAALSLSFLPAFSESFTVALLAAL